MWLELTELADEGSFGRGQDYARRGLVEITASTPDLVRAAAHGSSTYDVVLHARDWSCSCPVGVSGSFCKHLVAAALLADGDGDDELPDARPEAAASAELEAVGAWLASMPEQDVLGVLEELDRLHPQAIEALSRLRGRASGDVSALIPLLRSLRTRRYLDWREANDHGRRAHEAVDELEHALTPAAAPALVPLLETALADLLKVISRSDDSSGIQGDAAQRLADLHVAAASLARPDADRLARWLVKNVFDDDVFLELDVVRYADALGDRGVATYRRELDKRLAAKPDSWSGRHARKRLAVLDGDLDEIVRLVGGDLSSTFSYIELVGALLEAGHEDAALRYAVDGTRIGPSWHQTPRLYDAAVRLLRARGDDEEVLRLRRQQLADLPTESSYASLRTAAKACRVWPTERLAALDVLLERSPRSWLVVLLDEGETDLAWEASRDLQLDTAMAVRLVRERTKSHPEDAYDTYAALIEESLRVAGQRNYRQAVAYLQELRRACAAADQTARYAALVADLLETHRRRPTLVAMLRRLPS